MSRNADRVHRPVLTHRASPASPPSSPPLASSPSPAKARSFRPRRSGPGASLPGVLLAVLLALFGGSAAVQHQPGLHDLRSGGQSAGAHHQDPAQHLQKAIALPAHAATQAPLPLLPAADQNGPLEQRSHLLPESPQLSAAHLTHHSPRQGRAPPARTGI